MVKPSGRVTTALRMSDWARPVGVGQAFVVDVEGEVEAGRALAARVVGWAVIEGLKPSLAQPVMPRGLGGSRRRG